MNFLDQYYTKSDAGQFSISAEQASDFAKKVAEDFNPIHDAGSKRFCVPGDLLFAVALNHYGLREHMAFQFLDLVSADTLLNYPAKSVDTDDVQLQVVNDKAKPVLGVQFSGDCTDDAARIEQLIKKYVAFSGQNFPHILVPLMQQHGVMINPKRPLVIYESMSLKFDYLQFESLEINLAKTALDVVGKRGNAELHFELVGDGQCIGTGKKNLVLSGLREYEESAVQQMCDQYLASKDI